MSDAVLPQFPEFEHLDLRHKDLLRAIANNFPSYSDFNFVSLFTWDTQGDVLISQLHGNLVVRFTDYLDNSSFYSFLGSNKVDETARTLIEYTKQEGHKPELMLVPHSVASRLSSSLFEVSEDRDNHDYILSVQDLVEFRTNTYRGKKNLLNRFIREYGEHAVADEIDITNETKKQELLALLDEWQQSRQKSSDEVDNEFRAIEKAVTHAGSLDVKVFGVYVKDRLVGFTLFELLPNKVAVIHFDKANVDYVGVFEFLKHEFAKHISASGVESINYEQDLGLEGLRRAKESYHPIDYLKKYTVKIRN